MEIGGIFTYAKKEKSVFALDKIIQFLLLLADS